MRTMLRPCRALAARAGRGAAPVPRQSASHAPPQRPPHRRAASAAATHAPPAAELQADSSAAAAADAPAASRPIKLRMTQAPARPNKSLGQHFLTDASVVKAALAAAGVAPGDRVLEVGPGTGMLTAALLAAGARVTALEKDATLAAALAANNAQLVASGALTVVHDDVLRWLRSGGAATAFHDADVHASAAAPRAKVVANIPYAISTELLGALLPRGGAFQSLTLLVQEELAQRLVVAAAGASDAREMSLRVRFYSQPRYVRFVGRAAFNPPPMVDSAVVSFALAAPADWPLQPGARTAAFFGFLRAAFASRRKMLRKTLSLRPGASAAEVAAALQAADVAADARPQELSLPQFLTIFRRLHPDTQLPAAAAPGASHTE